MTSSDELRHMDEFAAQFYSEEPILGQTLKYKTVTNVMI